MVLAVLASGASTPPGAMANVAGAVGGTVGE
jgi:hypothetical protein